MSSSANGNKYIFILQEFSIPLLLGVVVALIVSNANPDLYHRLVNETYTFFGVKKANADDHEVENHGDEIHDDGTSQVADPLVAGEPADEKTGNGTEANADDEHGGHGWEHYLTLHFFINEIFMVVFFGIAAKEITESCLPGGALNPLKKAINPLLGTIGGVLGPVGVYFVLNMLMGEPAWRQGWGIPTATDIALAWLIARIVFGTGHPAISFLLLLAVADDGIGLLIIAFFYPQPGYDPEWLNVLWMLVGMAIAAILRWRNTRSWVPYIVFGGIFSWWGLYSAHLHPALALVPIIPFLPHGKKDQGLFREEAGVVEDNALDRFEHDLKLIVDFGLFFFAFANAGVAFANMSNLTWIVLLSLLIGKTIGISLFSWVGSLLGIPLPEGMTNKHLVVAGVIAGLGLTVALFVAGQAFPGTDPNQGAAKMGALFSGGAAILAIVLGRILGLNKGNAAQSNAKNKDSH